MFTAWDNAYEKWLVLNHTVCMYNYNNSSYMSVLVYGMQLLRGINEISPHTVTADT